MLYGIQSLNSVHVRLDLSIKNNSLMVNFIVWMPVTCMAILFSTPDLVLVTTNLYLGSYASTWLNTERLRWRPQISRMRQIAQMHPRVALYYILYSKLANPSVG